MPDPRPVHARRHYLAALLPAGLFMGFAAALGRTAAHQHLLWEAEWVAALGVPLAFRLDGLSMLFGLVITGIGTLVTLYSGAYLGDHHHGGRYQVLLQSFMLAMLGLVLADNLILLYVFWELTTFTSFLLIGFEHEKTEARESARQALFVTGAGGLAMLAGFVLMGSLGGTFRISSLAAQGDLLRAAPVYPVILVLVLAGAFTKSAQVPFHFWLPNAMAAPTPISAYLHSATMVKAGIYLLARLHPALSGTDAWTLALTLVGSATALFGSVLALGQTDMKRLLAYTTVMGLGILTLFLGGSHTAALVAALTFFLVHALYKSALFLVVGILDHETGTRQVDAVRGLATRLPWTACGAAAAALSMAGFPLFFGFIGKEIMYEGALHMDSRPVLFTAVAVAANALMTAAAGVLFIRPFLGRPSAGRQVVHEAAAPLFIGPLLLGGTGILFGVIPWWVDRWLVRPALVALGHSGRTVELTLFHGWSTPLLLSILTLSLGIAGYAGRKAMARFMAGGRPGRWFSADALYAGALKGVSWSGGLVVRWLQNGSLHRYLFIVMLAFVGLSVWRLPIERSWPAVSLSSLSSPEWLLVSLETVAVTAVVFTRRRLVAIAGLGVVGAGLALIFLMNGAPDLALTQLMVETLTVVIVAIVLLRLPDLRDRACGDRPVRLGDGLLAAAAGTVVTVLLLQAGKLPLDRTVTAFYEQQSFIAAHGRNIVNVILVDFRALDTLGEITVVALAGLAGYALIRGGRKGGRRPWKP